MTGASPEPPQDSSEAADDVAIRKGRLDDLQVYVKLVSTSDELRDLSARCWSIYSSDCLRVCSLFVRKIASLLHQHNLR